MRSRKNVRVFLDDPLSLTCAYTSPISTCCPTVRHSIPLPPPHFSVSFCGSPLFFSSSFLSFLRLSVDDDGDVVVIFGDGIALRHNPQWTPLCELRKTPRHPPPPPKTVGQSPKRGPSQNHKMLKQKGGKKRRKVPPMPADSRRLTGKARWRR